MHFEAAVFLDNSGNQRDFSEEFTLCHIDALTHLVFWIGIIDVFQQGELTISDAKINFAF
jgi:hypothetical protein